MGCSILGSPEGFAEPESLEVPSLSCPPVSRRVRLWRVVSHSTNLSLVLDLYTHESLFHCFSLSVHPDGLFHFFSLPPHPKLSNVSSEVILAEVVGPAVLEEGSFGFVMVATSMLSPRQ